MEIDGKEEENGGKEEIGKKNTANKQRDRQLANKQNASTSKTQGV